MIIKPLDLKELPEPISLTKLIGPSFIILGMGLGSGEIILWPYLASNYGMGIIWGAILGITFQYFMNMEIERYALSHGESIFVGFARKFKFAPLWFIFSTFIPWIWPGIAVSSATFLGAVFGIQDIKFLAIGMLLLIGLILSFGPVLYKTVETLQKVLICVGVPAIFIFALLIANKSDWAALAMGAIGKGNGYWLFPAGISLSTFLGALAFAGAGGNLNLSQSSYIKEKGYGMGKYAGRITSLLTGRQENVSISGSKFEETEENTKRFKKWWKNINVEHAVVFWITGTLTICFLALLSYATTYHIKDKAQDIAFVIQESQQIGNRLIPAAGILFLIVVGVMLFATQLTIFDGTSRIISENIILAGEGRLQEKHIPISYYMTLWLQIFAAILIYLFAVSAPLQLVTISALLNAGTMFVHVGMTLWINSTLLHKSIRPNFFRKLVMSAAFLFYGGFSLYVLIDKFF